MNDPEYLVPLNKEAALQKRAEIDELLGQISTHEIRLARSYARLGSLIREVKTQQYWITYGYNRFTEYLEVIREKIGRERSQMYGYLSVAESLLPALTEEQLEDIGYSKAQELRRLVQQGGNINIEIPDPSNQSEDTFGTIKLTDYAADPKVTAKQLRVKINEILHVKEENQGLWLDLSGFYATPDERKEIDQFWSLGKQLLGPKDEQQEHVWRKIVFMDAVRECVSTWQGEVRNEVV
jgi:hypothetical protein